MDTIQQAPALDLDVIIARVTEAFSNGATLGDLIGYDDDDYEAVYALGHSFYAQARYLDALKAFGFLVMNNPLERRFVNSYASCLQMQKRHEDAIAFYGLASMMEISNPGPIFHTAECLIALGRIPEAVDALGIVVDLCEKPDQEALKTRAQALLDLLKAPQSENGRNPE